jgi:putative sigma-54 modulation protein
MRLVKGARKRGLTCRVNRRTLRIPVTNKRLGGPPIVQGRARNRKVDRAANLHIRVLGTELGNEDRQSIRRKLDLKLGKFAKAIERVSVRVEDVNGPRGGIDQVCRIKVVVRGQPSVVVEKRDASLNAAIDAALAGVERAVRRTVPGRRARGARRASSP